MILSLFSKIVEKSRERLRNKKTRKLDASTDKIQGFCSMWGLYLMHMSILNPNSKRKELLKFMQTQSAKTLRKKIQNYTAFWIQNWESEHKNLTPNLSNYTKNLLKIISRNKM